MLGIKTRRKCWTCSVRPLLPTNRKKTNSNQIKTMQMLHSLRSFLVQTVQERRAEQHQQVPTATVWFLGSSDTKEKKPKAPAKRDLGVRARGEGAGHSSGGRAREERCLEQSWVQQDGRCPLQRQQDKATCPQCGCRAVASQEERSASRLGTFQHCHSRFSTLPFCFPSAGCMFYGQHGSS